MHTRPEALPTDHDSGEAWKTAPLESDFTAADWAQLDDIRRRVRAFMDRPRPD